MLCPNSIKHYYVNVTLNISVEIKEVYKFTLHFMEIWSSALDFLKSHCISNNCVEVTSEH